MKLLGNKYKFDFVITEIGGTVGDIESLPYLESIRQLKRELGKNALCVHLTYVPYLAAAGELKTKPTQHSVKELQSVGIQPDILVLRTERSLSDGLRKKVAKRRFAPRVRTAKKRPQRKTSRYIDFISARNRLKLTGVIPR